MRVDELVSLNLAHMQVKEKKPHHLDDFKVCRAMFGEMLGRRWPWWKESESMSAPSRTATAAICVRSQIDAHALSGLR